MLRRCLGVCAIALGLTTVSFRPAEAIPVFAHRYGLTCQACHTVVPHLTSFGATFLANGYRLPGVKPLAAFPVAVRVEANYASAGAADPDESNGPLPKTIVNEVEFLMGGSIGTRGSYWVEQYAVDGGFPGRTRDVWYAQRLTADGARFPIVLRAGQFTLPLPLDPRRCARRRNRMRFGVSGREAIRSRSSLRKSAASSNSATRHVRSARRSRS